MHVRSTSPQHPATAATRDCWPFAHHPPPTTRECAATLANSGLCGSVPESSLTPGAFELQRSVAQCQACTPPILAYNFHMTTNPDRDLEREWELEDQVLLRDLRSRLADRDQFIPYRTLRQHLKIQTNRL